MTTEKTMVTGAIRQRRPAKVFTAKEKATAVISVWSSRRKPSAISKGLGINWGVLNMWEKMAINGILRALGADEQQLTAQQGLNLGNRLERLLAVPERVMDAVAAQDPASGSVQEE